MSDSEEEIMHNTKEVYFMTPSLRISLAPKLSERTGKFLQEKCTRRVPNFERRKIREKFPFPKVPATRPVQLDPMMKSEASFATKATDKQRAKVQTQLLDSLAPFTSILETHHKGKTLDT